MRVWDRVDLPEPLGPITACTSPLLIASVTPLRISLPSTLALRSRISKSATLYLFSFTSYVQSGAASAIQVDLETGTPRRRSYICCSFWHGSPVRAATSWIGQLQWR